MALSKVMFDVSGSTLVAVLVPNGTGKAILRNCRAAPPFTPGE